MNNNTETPKEKYYVGQTLFAKDGKEGENCFRSWQKLVSTSLSALLEREMSCFIFMLIFHRLSVTKKAFSLKTTLCESIWNMNLWMHLARNSLVISS